MARRFIVIMAAKKYTRELADEICARMSEGENLITICEEKGIARSIVSDWARLNHDGFYPKYTRARQRQIEYLLDDLVRKVDAKKNDFFVDKKGVLHTNHAAIQRDRLIADTLKWVACKVVPKMPSFKGSLLEMGNNIIQGVENNGLPTEQAIQMMKLVESVAAVKKVDEFDEAIKLIPNMQKQIAEFEALLGEQQPLLPDAAEPIKAGGNDE